jgi:hypothetical protein
MSFCLQQKGSQLSEITLIDVMAQHPHLTLDGIGLVRVVGERGPTSDERFAAGRVELAERGAKVAEVVAWFRENFTPIQTPSQGSYQLKELARPRLGYISNGELIAAGFIVGYPYR